MNIRVMYIHYYHSTDYKNKSRNLLFKLNVLALQLALLWYQLI